MKDYSWYTRRIFCDWHMPDFLPELKLDAKFFVDSIVEVGGQSLTFMCKSAFGNCLYPSRVAYANRQVGPDNDIFGEVCRLSKERGLEFIAYYNMLLDDEMGRHHPEWLQRDSNGAGVKFEHYSMFCMNSPYRDYVFRHLEEIASNFEIDGFMFDIQYFHPTGCFCNYCREGFAARFGYELDESVFSDVGKLLDLYEFQAASRQDFILTAVGRARAVRPGLLFTWNGCGADNRVDAYADFLGGEVHPPRYLDSLLKAKWFQSSGKNFDLWMPETIGSWGHWSITTGDTLKGMSAVALAHGGAIGINHVSVPCGDYAGRVFPAVYDTIAESLSWVKEREGICMGSRAVPVTALLFSSANSHIEHAGRICRERSKNTVPRTSASSNLESAVHLLAKNSMPFDILQSEDAAGRINDYETVILPDIGYMDDKLADMVRGYAAGGGKVLATYNTSLTDERGSERENFLLADLFGADFDGFSDFSITYVDNFHAALQGELPRMPMLIKDAGYQQNPLNRALYCHLRPGAEALAFFTEPAIESDWSQGYHIYHDQAPPGRITERPAIIINPFGKGMSAFLPFPLLQANTFQPNPWYRRLFKQVIAFMGLPGRACFEGPPSVNVSLTERDNEWLLHLINLQRETDTIFIDGSAVSGSIRCRLQPPWPVTSVEYAVDGSQIEFDSAGGAVSFTLPGVRIYDIIRIAGRV